MVHIQTPSFMPSLFTDTMPPQAYRAMEGKSPRARSIQKNGTIEEGTTACIRSHKLTIWCGSCVTCNCEGRFQIRLGELYIPEGGYALQVNHQSQGRWTSRKKTDNYKRLAFLARVPPILRGVLSVILHTNGRILSPSLIIITLSNARRP